MRRWFIGFSFSVLVVPSVSAQTPDPSDRAPLGAPSVFGSFETGSPQAIDDSNFSGPMTGMYLQFSGLSVNPEDTDISSRDPVVDAGLGDTEMSYKSGWGFGFAIGYDFNAGAESAGRDVPIAIDPRVEFESVFRFPANRTPLIGDPDEPINDDPMLATFAINGFLDIDIKGPVDPYIGAGIGLTYVEFGDSGDFHEHRDQFGTYVHRHDEDVSDDWIASYQLMAGVNIALSRNWSMYGGVRYFVTDDMDIDNFTFDFTSTDIEFGMRVMLR